MNVDKSISLQKQVRDNSEDLRAYLNDLVTWEKEMKRKESELKEEGVELEAPDVKKNSDKTSSNMEPAKDNKKKQKKSDGEIEKIDKNKDEESNSSDNKEDTLKEHNMRLRDESIFEKERGNQFVHKKKWIEAIACYTHAIACYSKDPVFFANRALCFLKKNDMPSAENDCTSALQLDPTYVKALQRRAAARASLRQVKAAIVDLERVLQLEPHNVESIKELKRLQKSITTDRKDITKRSKAVKKPVDVINTKLEPSTSKMTVQEIFHVKQIIPWPNRKLATVVAPVEKLPHQYSKKPLRRVEIHEDNTKKEDKRLPDNIDCSANNALPAILGQSKQLDVDEALQETNSLGDKTEIRACTETVSSVKFNTDISSNEIQIHEKVLNFPVPKSSVQFYANWKTMKDDTKEKYLYLAQMKPADLPNIFQQYLESDIISEIINIMKDWFINNNLDVYSYLLALSNVKRFSALIMFLSNEDKLALNVLFNYCATKDNILTEELHILRKKYEV